MSNFINAICNKTKIESGGRVFIKTEIIDESYNPSNYRHNPVVDYKDIDPGQFVIKEELDDYNTGFLAQIKVEENLSSPVIATSNQCNIIIKNTDTGDHSLINYEGTKTHQDISPSPDAQSPEELILKKLLTSSNCQVLRESYTKDITKNKSFQPSSKRKNDYQVSSHQCNIIIKNTDTGGHSLINYEGTKTHQDFSPSPDAQSPELILKKLLTSSNCQVSRESYTKDITKNKSFQPSKRKKCVQDYRHNPIVDYKDIDPGQFVIKEELDDSNTGFLAQIKVEENLSSPVIATSNQCDIIIKNTDTGDHSLTNYEGTKTHQDFSPSPDAQSPVELILKKLLTSSNCQVSRESYTKDITKNKSYQPTSKRKKYDQVTSNQCEIIVKNTDIVDRKLINYEGTKTLQDFSPSPHAKSTEELILKNLLTSSNCQVPRESYTKDISKDNSFQPSRKRKLHYQGDRDEECQTGNTIFENAEVVSKTLPDKHFENNNVGESPMEIDNRMIVKALLPKNLRFITGEYKCYCCSEEFRLLSDWEDHILQYFEKSGCFPMKKHTPKRLFYKTLKQEPDGTYHCHKCSRSLPIKTHLYHHYIRVHEHLHLKCAVCPKMLSDYRTLKTHLYTVHNSLQKMLNCPYCNYVTPSKNSLKVHINLKHLKQGYIKCQYCDKMEPTKTRMRDHVNKKHTASIFQKKYTCSLCPYTSLYSKCLAKHIKYKHTEAVIFKCFYCLYKTKSKWILQSHLKQFHSKLFGAVHKEFKCDRCDLCFLSKVGLRTHTSKTHSKILESYPCRFCDKTFKAKYLCFVHINQVHLSRYQFQCYECLFVGKNVEGFKKHVLRTHSIKFYCHHCSYTASTKFRVKDHIISVHSLIHKKKRFKCKSCKYSSDRKTLFVQHVNVKHNPNPIIYTCYHCGHNNKIKHKLYVHMWTKHQDIVNPRLKKKPDKKTV